MNNGLCWVSTLTYPNLLGIKRLCWCWCSMCLRYCIWAQNHTSRLLHLLWKYGTLCWSRVLTMQSTTVSCKAESAAQCSYAKSFLSWWNGTEGDNSLKEFCSNIFQASELQTSMIETMEAVEMEKQRHHSTRMEALARLARLEVYRCLPILSPTPSAIFMSNSADGVYGAFHCCGGK